jgi:hypothetical protein
VAEGVKMVFQLKNSFGKRGSDRYLLRKFQTPEHTQAVRADAGDDLTLPYFPL